MSLYCLRKTWNVFCGPDMVLKIIEKKINLGTVKMSGYYYSSQHQNSHRQICRSIHPEVFLEKGVLKICSRFTGEHPCRSVISIKLLCNFIEIIFRQGCSPVTLLHIFRTSFTKNTSGRRLLGFSVLFTILFYT